MIEKSVNDPKRAASLVSTLISAVATNENLAKCKPESVLSAALRGEGMGLSLALSHYSLVPYGDIANFQISYKGLSQLATRSGQYKDFGVFDVREGEYKGKDGRTRQPVIEWIDDEDEREKLPIIGYYGFYELHSGFFKSVYWTHEKILRHADRYSKAFDMEEYKKLWYGDMDAKQAKSKIVGKSPWLDEPTSEAHMKMCRKTVLLQMIGDGIAPLSIEMQTVMATDRVIEQGGQSISVNDPAIAEANSKTGEVVIDNETGEIIENNEQ